jgi:hypothetical protein
MDAKRTTGSKAAAGGSRNVNGSQTKTTRKVSPHRNRQASSTNLAEEQKTAKGFKIKKL